VEPVPSAKCHIPAVLASLPGGHNVIDVIRWTYCTGVTIVELIASAIGCIAADICLRLGTDVDLRWREGCTQRDSSVSFLVDNAEIIAFGAGDGRGIDLVGCRHGPGVEVQPDWIASQLSWWRHC